MKQIIHLVVIGCLVAGCALAQLSSLPTKPWNAKVEIVGEDNLPISEADVLIGYTIPPYAFTDNLKYSGQINGHTDTNGVFSAKNDDRSDSLGFRIQKAGYYSTVTSYRLGDPKQYADRRNISLKLTLKKIGKPIAMYAKQVETKIEKENEPAGFDLTVGDWVAPLGSGQQTDVFITVHRKVVSDREYRAELKLTFPNRGDGIIVAPTEPNQGSEFKTSRTAADGGYESERTWHWSNTQRPESVFGYFFRVRTALDENGKVKTALYGKIRGDFRFYVGTKAPRAGMGFDYYLNPKPNDRNLEFDPKQNLLKKLSDMEQVREP